jgi:Fe-S-cluster containining protein
MSDKTERRCRTCTACCTILEIPGFKKAMERCQHLGRLPNGMEGCTIYATRPQPCRDFICAWMQGYGSTQDRPDKLGLMVTSEHAFDDQGNIDQEVGEVAKVYETRSGASAGERAQKLYTDIVDRKKALVIITKKNPDGTLNPERQIKVPERLRHRFVDFKRLAART